jgi:hypothetical protein
VSHTPGHLGRRVPKTWEHVEKYPLRLAALETVETVERRLPLRSTWRDFYNQGREGACVGFSCSQMMTILNRKRYDARWLWNRAKEIDEWDDTNPGDDNGTSVRAAMDILRDVGHSTWRNGTTSPPSLTEGITENRWATSVDEVRQAIANGIPVVLGTNWYSKFDNPTQKGREWWLAEEGDGLGFVRGGHAYLVNYASDKRQAFRTPNSWGKNWPPSWISYDVIQRLINEHGEAALITDRI